MIQICSNNGGCHGSDGCNGGGDDESSEPPNITGRTVGGGLLAVTATAPTDPARDICVDESSPNAKKCAYFNEEGVFDFDLLLQKSLGEFGRYQQFIVWFLCIPACVLSAFSTLDLVFIAYTPSFLCDAPKSFADQYQSGSLTSDLSHWFGNNSSSPQPIFTVDKEQCGFQVSWNDTNATSLPSTVDLKCSKFVYDKTYFQSTIVTEWNLVCEKAIAARSIVSLLNVAILFAAVYTYIEDKWGRKVAFLINLLFFIFGSCSSLLAQSPIIFALLKFLGSITCLWEICYTWALEFVGPSQRTALTTMLSVIYCAATMLLALLAYLCNTWVEFGLCTSAPFALLFSYGFFIPESPRWLLTQGRIDEALRIIESMARWQKVKIDYVALREAITGKKSTDSTISVGIPSSTSSSAAVLLPDNPLNNKDEVKLQLVENPVVIFTEDAQSTSGSEASENSASKLIGTAAFLSSSNLRWKSFALTAIEIVANQLYYAIPYSLETLSANFYVSYVLQAAVEAPATLLNLLLLNRFGRIVPLSVTLFLSGSCCLLTLAGGTLFGDFSYGPVILVVVSRFFICTAVAIVEQLGGELFPTVARGTGQGVSYFLSSLASISTQYILYASHIWAGLPMLIFGSMIVVVSFMTLFLPETMGKSLPDTVRQAEAQGSVGWTSFKRNLPLLTKFCCKRFKKRKMYRLSANGLTSADLLPKSVA